MKDTQSKVLSLIIMKGAESGVLGWACAVMSEDV